MSKNELTLQKQQRLITKCKNKDVTDEFIKRYQQSTKNAIEQILNMGEAVSDVYRKNKLGELHEDDLNYFCQSVGLDPKGSTFRKYKAIGINADRFRQHMAKMPSSFSLLYEFATLDADDFEKFVVKKSMSKSLTLMEFKKITKKTLNQKKRNLYNPPALSVSPQSVSKVIKVINQFSIHIVRDLNKSDFDSIVEQLTFYRNKGWIRFDAPSIEEFIDDEVAEDLKAA